MKYRRRLGSLLPILTVCLGFSYYLYQVKGSLSPISVVVSILTLIIAWAFGKQYDRAAFYNQQLQQALKDQRMAVDLLCKREKLSIAGELAAGVAHEIRNPLTSINGFLQLMKVHREVDDEKIDLMLSELEQINRITSELLLLGRPQAVKLLPKDLIKLMQDVIMLVQPQAVMNSIEISYTAAPDIPLIFCEEPYLKQAFIHILKNAIDASPPGSMVKVELLRVETDHVRIQVTDCGPGIPKDLLSKLGEPFYSTKVKGTGLGLTITRRIVEAHKGILGFQSEEGSGTTAHITLPINVNF